MTAELLREFIAFAACERGEPSPALIEMTRLPDDHPDALGWEDRARRAGLIVDEDASPRPQKRSNQPARLPRRLVTTPAAIRRCPGLRGRLARW
jgi:hypothetical protein